VALWKQHEQHIVLYLVVDAWSFVNNSPQPGQRTVPISVCLGNLR